MSLLSNGLKLSFKLAEAGLIATESMVRSAQTALETVAGIGRDLEVQAPTEGPRDLDHALSDLANRTVRIGHFTPLHPNAMGEALERWLRSARTSFRFVDWKDPRSLALPAQLPFSLATLMTSAALRGLAAFQVIGAPRYLEFLRYSVEIFSEFPVYVRLEYADLIERQLHWLESHPQDAATRADVGRALVKVGRYDEAADHLRKAADANPALRSVAMHEAGLAYYFSGRFADALQAGCAALDANPDNAPARLWTWLAAERLGGYPEHVPAAHRLAVKVGWEKASVQYEEGSTRPAADEASRSSITTTTGAWMW
jgi:tetratricopeptide (TPR) repeat protein